MFVDFWVMLDWARELWHGQYNYSLYPPTALIFYFPFLFLEPSIALSIFLCLSAIFFVVTFGKKAIYWITFIPAFQTLLLAHPDIIFVFLLKKRSPLTLALLTLKPVLFLVGIPDVLAFSLKNKLRFLFYILILYIPSFIFVKNWPEIYIRNILNNGLYDERFSAIGFLSDNILLSSVIILILFIFLNRDNFRYLLMLVISFSFFMSYNYVLFTGTNWIFIPLSWLFVNLQNPPWISFNYYFITIPVLLYLRSGLCQFMIFIASIAAQSSQKFSQWKKEINGLSALNVGKLSNGKLPEQV